MFRQLLSAVAVLATSAVSVHAHPAAGVASAAAVGVASPPVDPFPIRRVLIPPDRVDSVVTSVGVLRRMPRDEFEAKVRAASTALAAAADPPRLVGAIYRATLADGALTGTGEWTVAYPGGPGFVTLDPLRAAITNPRWADRPAVLFRPATGGPPVLLADRPSDTAVSFRWSARGADEPGAERFDLGLPPAAVAGLDLDLPAGRVPAADPPTALVTGPFPGSAADRRRWAVAFGGVGNLSLTVRRPAGPSEPAPLVRAGRVARYGLTPGDLTTSFEFDWEVVRGTVEELVFAVDPGLRVTGVETGRPAAWRDDPGGLRVPLRGPASSGKVMITASTPAPASSADGWPLPGIRLAGGLPGPDAVELRFDPDVQFLGLDPGDYRPTDGGATDDRGGYRIALAGAGGPRPPLVRFGPAGPAFAVTEDVTWRPGPGRAALSGRFRLRVDRGPVAEILLDATPGFALRSVTLTPDDPGASWSAGPRMGQWSIEPSRPIPAGQVIEVRVELSGNSTFAATDPSASDVPARRVSFPRLGVAGAGERDGTFTVQIPPALHGVPAPLPPEPGGPPAPGGPATYSYPYRGRGPDGVLVVGPRPPRVAVSTDTTVSLDPAGLEATTRILLRCEAGEVGGVTLFLPDPPGGPVAWDVRPVAGAPVRAELLLQIGAADGWAAVGRVGVAAATSGWVQPVRFARPLRGETEITTTVRWPVEDGPTVVPVPSVGGADAATGTVTLTPPAATRFDVTLSSPAGFPARASLLLRGSAASGSGVSQWQFADVVFTTKVEPDGRLWCELAGRIADAGGPTLPVALPAGAEILDVRAGGRVADPSASVGDTGVRLDIPLPAVEPGGLPFEVRYRVPPPSASPIVRFRSPLPELPAGVDVRRRWAFDPEFLPTPALSPRPEPADDARESVLAVRGGWLTAAGFAAAAVVGGLGVIVAARRRRAGLTTIAFLCVLLTIGAWVLPTGWRPVLVPPLLAGLLGVAGFRRAEPVRPPTGSSTVSHPAAKSRADVWPNPTPVPVGVLLGLAVLAPAAAQAPEPATVYLTPTADGRYDALVPPAVADRLDALTRPTASGPVITSSEYEGTSTNAVAIVDATFAVWCRGGNDTLAMPLAGGRLLSLTVDGADGFPGPAGPDRYAVAVPGAGGHTVRARFEVPVVAAGADREVRFTGPDVPACRVGFIAPAGGTRPAVATRRGGQTVAGAKVEADHGGGGLVVVRWRAAGPTPAPTAGVSARSACVWTLRDGDASAIAVFQVRVDGGSVDHLRFEIPDGLEPGRVEVQPGGLRDWSLTPGPSGWRVFDLGLQAAVTGRVTVGFRLYPTRPLGAKPTLRFPRSHRVEESDAVCAIRLAGMTADAIDRAGLVDVPPDVLTREFAGLPDIERPGPVRTFRRSGAGPPELTVTLRPIGAATGAAETTWAVGPRAEADGVVRAVSTDGPIPLVEFELSPTVVVRDVSGADVAVWGRVGNRVQAWLKKPAREAVVRWSGALAGYRPPTTGETPPAVELPVARGPGGVAAVRVRPAAGWGLVPQPVRGLRPAPDPTDPGGERLAADPTVSPTPSARVLLFSPAVGKVQALELVESVGVGLTYRADLLVNVRPGRPASLTVLLAGGRGGKLDPGPGLNVAGPIPTPEGPAWVVTAPPAVTGQIRFAVTVPLPAGKDVRLPEPTVWFGQTRTAIDRRVLVIGDNRVSPAGPRAGWEPAAAADLAALTALWPAESARVTTGRVWLGGRGPGADRIVAMRNAEFGLQNETPKPAPTAPPPPAVPVLDSAIRNPHSAFSLAGWLVVFAAVVGVAGWGRPGRWGPERLVGCGLLGVTVPGVGAASAVGCGLVAVAGGVLRVGRAFQTGRG